MRTHRLILTIPHLCDLFGGCVSSVENKIKSD
jgi:hypothetical protein